MGHYGLPLGFVAKNATIVAILATDEWSGAGELNSSL